MPTEAEMLPKDKYTIFDRKAKKYRKGIHSTFCWCFSGVGAWEGVSEPAGCLEYRWGRSW